MKKNRFEAMVAESGDQRAVLYDDGLGPFDSKRVFYPEALMPITELLADLNVKKIRHIRSFRDNIAVYLQDIIGYFRRLQDMHRAGLGIYNRYRTEGHQYCLYL